MLLDIDHFKQINDTHGHSVGDEVLSDIAAALANQTRDGDILARFGGEEFVLALPVTDVVGAKQLAQRIREAVLVLRWRAKRKKIKVTLSIGITALELTDTTRKKEPPHEVVLEELLKQADLALYYCKQHGRDQVRAYQELPGDSQLTPGSLI
jgi:diguanylate cyclase (GGDEF)-like protein